VLLGILGAAVAAVAYGVATIAQAVGVRRLGGLAAQADWRDKGRAGLPYAIGLGLDGIGFLASIGALRSLPLFLVQSAVAGSVAVTALLARVFLRAQLSRTEVAAIGATMLGLVLLAVSAHEGSGKALSADARWLLLAGAPVLAAVVVGAMRLRDDGAASTVLAASCGLGFGFVGIAARTIVVPHHLVKALTDPSLWSILGYGAVSIVAYGLALHRGRVTTVAAITFAVETLVPAVIGLLWLGDAVRVHLVPVASIGFFATVAVSIALAARAEVGSG